MKVLLFEPHINLRVILRGILHGYNITEIYFPSTALEAFQMLMLNDIDLFILSDKIKPLTGEKSMQLIRSAREKNIRSVRTIVTTHSSDIDEIKKLLAAGTDEILVMPYSMNAANARLHRVINNRATFIETIPYTGPDRRRRQTDDFEEEKRSSTNKPEPKIYNQPLRILLRDMIKTRVEAKEKIVTQSLQTVGEVTIKVNELEADMELTSPIKTNSGVLITQTGSILTERLILKIVDLVSTGRVQNEFNVRIG